MSEPTTLLGLPVHLVLEDEHGAFEVLGGLSYLGSRIEVDLHVVMRAISERKYGHPPTTREVEFRVAD